MVPWYSVLISAIYTLIGTRAMIVGFRAAKKDEENWPPFVAFIHLIAWPVIAFLVGFVAIMGGGAGIFESKE